MHIAMTLTFASYEKYWQFVKIGNLLAIPGVRNTEIGWKHSTKPEWNLKVMLHEVNYFLVIASLWQDRVL